jgi:hypothetical protein
VGEALLEEPSDWLDTLGEEVSAFKEKDLMTHDQDTLKCKVIHIGNV